MKPVIAISGRRWLGSAVGGFPDNFADLGIDLHVGAYADSVAAAGGLPILLPCSDAAIELVRQSRPGTIAGIVLTGGADVDPALYGEVAVDQVYGVDQERDRIEIALAKLAIERCIPLLAICRGMQVLNVALGGSMRQHLDPTDLLNHAAWHAPATETVHTISFSDGSCCSRLFGATANTNSLHHQSLGRIGEGLVVTGASKLADGGAPEAVDFSVSDWSSAPELVVEAVELPGFPVLGVQWHPELLSEAGAGTEPTFRWLIAQSIDRQILGGYTRIPAGAVDEWGSLDTEHELFSVVTAKRLDTD